MNVTFLYKTLDFVTFVWYNVFNEREVIKNENSTTYKR